jgi:PUA-domain protein
MFKSLSQSPRKRNLQAERYQNKSFPFVLTGDKPMPHKTRRYALKSSDAKTLFSNASKKLGINLMGLVDSKANVEAIGTGRGELLLINRKPLLFRTIETVYPTLLFEEIISKLPKVVVDMGAVRHVCNGAGIMAPGIVNYEGEFKKGDLVSIVDIKFRKRLALGEAQYDTEVAKSVKQGVVVKNIHYVSDEIWNVMKALAD